LAATISSRPVSRPVSAAAFSPQAAEAARVWQPAVVAVADAPQVAAADVPLGEPVAQPAAAAVVAEFAAVLAAEAELAAGLAEVVAAVAMLAAESAARRSAAVAARPAAGSAARRSAAVAAGRQAGHLARLARDVPRDAPHVAQALSSPARWRMAAALEVAVVHRQLAAAPEVAVTHWRALAVARRAPGAAGRAAALAAMTVAAALSRELSLGPHGADASRVAPARSCRAAAAQLLRCSVV
jgi:hypothetical protein